LNEDASSWSADRPNILIFMTDQEQAQVTLPDHPCKTPNLDKFAQEGIRFNYAYPPMAHCCPSRASLMTGLYPSQHGIYNNVLNNQAIHTSLYPGVETFSEKLESAGYDLYYCGKWHVTATEMPRDRGWKEVHVTSGIDTHHGIRPEQWKTVSGERYKMKRANGEILRPGWGTYKLYGTLEEGQDCSGDFTTLRKGIDTLKSLKDSQSPWCLYIGLNGPHDPFIIPEKYSKMYNPADIMLPPNYYDDLKDKPAVYRRMRKLWSQLTEEEVRESIAHYWGYCTMMDDMFGQVLDTLDENGQKDNTLVIFLSDHGEHCGAHGIYCKGISTFDEGYRIPCIMRWPDGIQEPGREVDQFVTVMDIAPTLLEIAGAESLRKCSGQSLVPFFRNEQPENWRDCIYTQCNGVEVYYTNRMVRTKNFKFVYNPTDIDELYDLNEDPYELHNLADCPEMKEVKEQMLITMWENAYQYEDTIFNPYPPIATADIGPAIYIE